MVVVRRNGDEHCALVDFGIGKLLTEDSTTGAPGTPAWSCKHNDHMPSRVNDDCDIYALGRVMFYMTTGQHPYYCEFPESDVNFGNMQYKATNYGADPELSNLIDDMISYSG